jgi:hypothetical protein
VPLGRVALMVMLLAGGFGSYTTTDSVTGWLKVERTKPWLDIPHVFRTGDRASGRVLRQAGRDWVEMAGASTALALADARRALIFYNNRSPGIFDERGAERARIPCYSVLAPDRGRIYCLEDKTTSLDTDPYVITLRAWSLDGAEVERHVATLPISRRPDFYEKGYLHLIGFLSTGEPAIEEVHMPRSLDSNAPRLSRLFALRGDTAVLVASFVRSPWLSYGAGAWKNELPWGMKLTAPAARGLGDD